jgi:5-oxoprolinase (ATP-hydrolysing) subunit A
MLAIDLSADLGEGCAWDAELLRLVSSASISCGAHAGDDEGIVRTLSLARSLGVTVGAHPGYLDREGFGRRERVIAANAVTSLVVEQVEHLMTLADGAGVVLRFVKPHGALYNQAQRDPELARGLVEAARTLGLALFGLPDSEVAKAAAESDVGYVAEGFADRGYRDDGSLIPRGGPGANLTDSGLIAEQVIRLVRSDRIRTLCIHGDAPGCVALATITRDTLHRHGVAIRNYTP